MIVISAYIDLFIRGKCLGGELSEYHSLVVANITLKLKAEKFTPRYRRRDITRLADKETGDKFLEALHKNIEKLRELQEIDERTKGLRKTIIEMRWRKQWQLRRG